MSGSPSERTRSRAGWALLRVVLLLEAAGGAVLVMSALPQAFAASADPLGARVSVLLAAVLAWAWVVFTLVGAWKRARWARASAATIHVLMFSAAVGILQGLLGPMPVIGPSLLVLSIAGFAAAMLARPEPAAE